MVVSIIVCKLGTKGWYPDHRLVSKWPSQDLKIEQALPNGEYFKIRISFWWMKVMSWKVPHENIFKNHRSQKSNGKNSGSCTLETVPGRKWNVDGGHEIPWCIPVLHHGPTCIIAICVAVFPPTAFFSTILYPPMYT